MTPKAIYHWCSQLQRIEKFLKAIFPIIVLIYVTLGTGLILHNYNTIASNKKARSLANCREINGVKASIVRLAQQNSTYRPSPAPNDPGVTKAWVEVNVFWNNVYIETRDELKPVDCTKLGKRLP